MKVCAHCLEEKPATVEFFNKKLDGFTTHCRQCRSLIRRAEHAQLPDSEKAELNRARRAARAADPEKHRARERALYGEAKKASVAAYRVRHPDAVKASNDAYYQRNKQARVAQAIAWGKENAERKRENHRLWCARKQSSDPAFRLRRAVSAHIGYSLRGQKGGQKWESLVGYTLADLVAHLERQFLRGMSWENYGRGWHIDHIVPASSFKYETPDDDAFKACWALTNLRPLWAAENIWKRDRRLFLL